MIENTDKHNCCGCEACVQTCPEHCISFDEDGEGFRYPKVDKSLCVDCGACERICPVLNPYDGRLPLSQVAAINPDNAIREQSSSGGIFTMLAEQVIRQGGVVFGVRFDEHWQAVFDYTETIEGIAVFRGSKYIQARVGRAFLQARDFLKRDRKVLFTGTSCQVAALRHFLRRDYDNLLLVDIICHGVPSPKVWGRYLDEVTQNTVHAISDVQFRNKKQGWKRFNFDLNCDAEGQYYNVSSWHQLNHFMRIFLQDVILRPSCYTCKAKGGRSGSDLTIADFWGIDQLNPHMDDDGGTSLVMVYTQKGVDHLNALALDTWEAQYADILQFNPSVEASKAEHPKRSEFFAQLDSSKSVVSLIDDILRIPFYRRVLHLPKRILCKARRTLSVLNGGGDFDCLTVDISSAEVPAAVLNHPVIAAFTFRSKHKSWKHYRMEAILKESDQCTIDNPQPYYDWGTVRER